VPHRVIRSLFLLQFLILAAGVSGMAGAQDDPNTPIQDQSTVVQKENVRTEYARVLRVEPVYQTLTATRMEHLCEAPSGKGLTRIVGAVKDALTPGKAEAAAAAAPQAEQNCRLVSVEREFKRPIAYDVDYVYKGSKYRSRLPKDPGSRLRVRVSVTPYLINGASR